MNLSPRTRKTILLLLIVSTSFSIGLWYLLLNTGLYSPPEVSNSWLLKNGLIWDGTGQAAFQGDILIRDGEIIEVKAGRIEAKEGVLEIDLTGKSVLPGLIDLSVQFYAPSKETGELSTFKQLSEYVRQRPGVRKNFLRNGVTSIRCLGDLPANIYQLQTQQREGRLAGPRVYAAGSLVTSPAGFPTQSRYAGNQRMIENATQQVADEGQLIGALEAIYQTGGNGVQFIYYQNGKSRLNPSLLEQGIAWARENGAWVDIYTGTQEEVRKALELSPQTLSFGGMEAWDSSLTLQSFIAAGGMYLPQITLHPEANALAENTRWWWEKGGRIGIGTGYHPNARYGESTLTELERLADLGIPIPTLLLGATSQAAQVLKQDHAIGSIQSGRNADLLVSAGKPWEEIKALRQLQYVWVGGKMMVEEGRLRE